MSISHTTIYTTSLQCNCPQCYTTSGLQLSFKQEWKETIWRKCTTEIVREELLCTMVTVAQPYNFDQNDLK